MIRPHISRSMFCSEGNISFRTRDLMQDLQAKPIQSRQCRRRFVVQKLKEPTSKLRRGLCTPCVIRSCILSIGVTRGDLHMLD